MKRTVVVVSMLAGIAVLPLAAMSQTTLEWIAPQRFVATRPDGSSVVRDFQDGLVTEVGMPALDAASKEPAKLAIKYASEPARARAFASPDRGDVSSWLPSNFRIEVPGVDCRKVSKVDAFTIKQSTSRDGRRELVAPRLVVWVGESSARSWAEWAGTPFLEQDTAVAVNDPRRDKPLSVFLSDGTPSRDFLQIRFGKARILSTRRFVSADRSVSYRVEMYCEEVALVGAPIAAGLQTLPAIRTPAPATSSPEPL
jgi:hypothetical protein